MGYKISDRSSFVLDSKSLLYTTTTGSVDKIKLDINYHSRCYVYPLVLEFPIKGVIINRIEFKRA